MGEIVLLGTATLRDAFLRRLDMHDRSDLAHKPLPEIWSLPVSRPGAATAVAFGGLTLLPSMLPKNALTQGVVLGINLILGYAIGVLWHWTWHFLELPSPRGRRWQVAIRSWYLVLGAMLAVSLWRHVGWQNRARAAFGMDTIEPTVWLFTLPIAIVVAGLLLITARTLRTGFNLVIRWFDRHLPRRLALLLGAVAFSVLMWALWSEVLVNGFFAAANQISAPIDASTDAGVVAPSSPSRSGSPASLVAWESLGRQGRTFVALGPSRAELDDFHGGGAVEPIRVYVGLESAPTVEERAELVLAELIRAGAFEREVLVVATTTGTGLLDPGAVDALEFVTNGDVAMAGVQYSYLPSPLSLLADADEVRATANAVFKTIHDHWSELPDEHRPAIYLYGMSLGSLGVESIFESIDIINEPVDGALLVGPPFVNGLHSRLVAGRDPGSSPATPVYAGGRTVRFAEAAGIAGPASGPWGKTRILYLQHSTDPVVFFSPDLLFERPDWLDEDLRHPDLEEGFHWIPMVTMWQVLTDLASANSVPAGFGHVYSIQAHAASWAAVIRPAGWTDAHTERLQEHLANSYPHPQG